MPTEPTLTIRYWGITGGTTAPLSPKAMTDKLVAALQHLLQRGQLAALLATDDPLAALRPLVENELPLYLRSSYGGHTTCVEVQTPEELILLDCGSGARELGRDLQRRWNASEYAGPRRTGSVLLSHSHLDHTIGVPMFAPFRDERNHFTLHGTAAVRRSLDAQLAPDVALSRLYYPITYEQMPGLRGWHVLEPGERFAVGATQVSTLALRHPGGCVAYRLDCNGRSFVFATDHEPAETPDQVLAEFARDADLLYLDGQYLAEEYEGRTGIGTEAPRSHRGWGHGTTETCVATAVAAGVRELHVGHRESRRSDAELARVEGLLQEQLRAALQDAGRAPGACRARIPHEGLTVTL